ncbi:MAG: hypothetical protein FD157_3320 [Rhodocyclaceae bacterium]|nr:MAG: hypothetical protein FD157_3320 [Rhodocyclaceae bacterium]TND03567.1 MAG: hypothetical protein FD118_1386 [Rhodocyclaceae bacterium]
MKFDIWRIARILFQSLGATVVLAGDLGATELTAGYLLDSNGNPVRTGTGLCIRTSYWTPALAIGECDPDLVRKVAPVAARPAAAPPAPAPPPPVKMGIDQTSIRYPVWFATNRKPTGDLKDCNKAYVATDPRAVRGDVSYGKCFVEIPASHIPGTLQRSWCDRILKRNADITIQKELQSFATFAAFLKDVKQTLASYSKKGKGGTSDVLVFIHGFNVTFQEATLRAAQIGYDLRGSESVTALYSWPSNPRNKKLWSLATGYTADEAAIEASEEHIANFLLGLARGIGPKRVHIIAHSMGNRGLLRGLFGAVAKAELKGTMKFGKIFLAAPDVDAEVFSRLARIYPRISERTTLYVSNEDKALGLSDGVHAFTRAGFASPPQVSKGIDTIDAAALPDNFLGQLGADTMDAVIQHSYYAKAAPILCDIRLTLSGEKAGTGSRKYLERRTISTTAQYWALPKQLPQKGVCQDFQTDDKPQSGLIHEVARKYCDGLGR